jgi:hypothetical protein
MNRSTQQESSGKEPGCFGSFLAVLGVAIAAPVAGLLLGGALAPDSNLARAVGLVAALASLLLGVLLWLGTLALRLAWSLVLLPFRLIFRLLTGRKVWQTNAGQGGTQTPPGSFVFVPVTVVVGAICGAVIGLVSETTSLLVATAILSGAGLVYGVILWRLARHGYLDGVVEGVLSVGLY